MALSSIPDPALSRIPHPLEHTATMNAPSFESSGGLVEQFDDGHVPETFRNTFSGATDINNNNDASSNDTSSSSSVPKMVRYPLHHPELPRPSSELESVTSDSGAAPSVRVYDDHLPQLLLNALYRTTTAQNNNRPWGTYVTINEAREWRGKHCHPISGRVDEGFLQQLLNNKGIGNKEDGKKEVEEYRHQLAVAVIALLLVDLATLADDASNINSKNDEHDNDVDSATSIGGSKAPSSVLPTNSLPPPLLNPTQNSQFLRNEAHGVAVWALSSAPGSEVRYHIDYAELIRYEHNVTVPPLLAGTVQCTRFGLEREDGDIGGGSGRSSKCCMDGGDFAVNLGGLNHYISHGYKGARSGDDRGGWIDPFPDSNDDGKTDYNNKKEPHQDEKTGWITIPYRYNRTTFHHGHLPHLSTPIKSISNTLSGGDDECSMSPTSNAPLLSRVILGMNVFAHDVGPSVQRAPEHSDAFNRKVKMYRALLSKSSLDNSNGMEGAQQVQMTVEAVRKNKALSKLLVLAKRERIKQDLKERQAKLTEQIWAELLGADTCNEGGATKQPMLVEELMDRLGKDGDKLGGGGDLGCWPSRTDVQVHLHHLILNNRGEKDAAPAAATSLDGRYRISIASKENLSLDEQGILMPSALLYLRKCEDITRNF